ncbi:hypothetical protein D3C87_203250 [compost metagenome]
MQTKLISDFISSTGMDESFSLELLEFVTLEPGKFYRPDHNIILFVTEGSVIVTVDSEVVNVNESTIVLISKPNICYAGDCQRVYIKIWELLLG